MKKVVLDACVLYPATLRDVLLSIGSDDIYKPYWSPLIHDEWQRNLLKNKSDLTQADLKRTAEIMDRVFIGSNINVNEFHHFIDQVNLPDANDRHILALAIHVKADLIITTNLKDFPEAQLGVHKVSAICPDEFLSNLFNEFDILVVDALRRQRARLKSPPITQEQFLEAFANCGLKKFSELLLPYVSEL